MRKDEMMRFLISVGLVAFLCASAAAPVHAQAAKKGEKKTAEKKAEAEEGSKKKKKKEETPATADLEVTGTLGALAKGSADMYEFTFVAPAEGKKKPAQKKAWLKIDSGTALLADRQVGLDSFKEGEALKIFAKPFETDSRSPTGYTGKFRNLQAARVVIGGKKVEVNEGFEDAKDKKFQWCEATIEKPGVKPTISYENNSYNISLDKGCAVIRREDGDAKKDVKKGIRIFLQAAKLDEKPAGEKDDGRPSFRGTQVIVLEPRCLNWYGAILP